MKLHSDLREFVALLNSHGVEYGFPDLGVTQDDLLKAGQIVQLGRPPNRIDLLTSISGVAFVDAWRTRIAGTLDELPVAYLDLESLLQNKRASGRPKDLADVDKLQRIQRERRD